MKSSYNKIIFILDNKLKYLYFIIFCFILSASLDLIGIGIIIPYINLILQEEIFYSTINDLPYLNFLTSFKYVDLILLFSFLLIFIFLLKTCFQLFIQFILLISF